MKSKLFLLSFILSAFAFGKTGSVENIFDKKVEQLFFNKDVSSGSVSLVDSLAKEKELDYIKPEGITTCVIGIGIMGFYKHVFDFRQSPESSISFDKGSIELHVNTNETQINDITWEMQYNKKEDAVAAFSDLFEYLCVPGVEHYLYHGKEIMEEAQFINKSSTKYPHISFKLIDNIGPDGKYKIRLSLS
jgi:hypothetical protein